MWIYKKGDIEVIDEMGTAEKGAPLSIIKAQLQARLQHHVVYMLWTSLTEGK